MDETITVSIADEIFKLFDSVEYSTYQAIKYAEGLKLNLYENQPTKPRLPHNHTHADIIKYAHETAEYDRLYVGYKERMELSKQHNEDVDKAIIDNIKRISGFKNLPVEVQDGLWQWIDDISSGNTELYEKANELCDILDKWPTPKHAM